jgi:excisionase family DNA binding protein
MITTAEPLLLSADQAAVALGISRRTLFTMTSRGEIAVCRLGARVMFSRDSLAKFIASRESIAPPKTDRRTTA